MSNPRAIAQVITAASALEGEGVTMDVSNAALFSFGQLVELYPPQHGDGAPLTRAGQTVRYSISAITGQQLTGTLNYDDYDNPPQVERGWIIDGRSSAGGPSGSDGFLVGGDYEASFSGIQAAMDDASLLGGSTVTLMGGLGDILHQGTALLPKDDVKLVLQKGTFLVTPTVPAAGAIFAFTGTVTAGSVLASSAARGTRTCTLTAGGALANTLVAGSICEIYNVAETRVQVNRVKSIAGEVIQWQYPMQHNWTTADKVRRWVTWLENFTLVCEDEGQLVGTGNELGFDGMLVQRHTRCDWQVKTRDFHGNPTTSLTSASGVNSVWGFESTFRDCRDTGSGDGGQAALQFNSDSYCHYLRPSTHNPFGFGQLYEDCHHAMISQPSNSGGAGRGLKLDNCRDWVMEGAHSNGNRHLTYGTLAEGIGIMISGVDNSDGLLVSPVAQGNSGAGIQTDSSGVQRVEIVSPSSSANAGLDLLTAVGDRDIKVSNPISESADYVLQATGEYFGIVHTVNTTDATPTVLASLAAAQHNVIQVETRVTGHRTGGAAGAVDDSAGYLLAAAFKGNGTSAIQVGATASLLAVQDQPAWGATIGVSGSVAAVVVTGAANNNVSWKSVTNGVIT